MEVQKVAKDLEIMQAMIKSKLADDVEFYRKPR